MSRFLACLALCVLLAAPTTAQQRKYGSQSQGSVRLGPMGGFRLGGLACMPLGAGLRSLPPATKSVTFRNSYGFLAGGVFAFRILPEAAAQTEALLTSRGFNRIYAFPLSQRLEELQVRQLCLEVPLLAKYNLNVFYGEAGIVNTFVLRTTYEQTVTLPDERPETSGSLPDARGYNLSAAVGIGIEMPEGYFLSLRYLQGLSKLGDEPAPGASPALNGQKLSMVSLQLSLGYFFNHLPQTTGTPLKHEHKKKRKR